MRQGSLPLLPVRSSFRAIQPPVSIRWWRKRRKIKDWKLPTALYYGEQKWGEVGRGFGRGLAWIVCTGRAGRARSDSHQEMRNGCERKKNVRGTLWDRQQLALRLLRPSARFFLFLPFLSGPFIRILRHHLKYCVLVRICLNVALQMKDRCISKVDVIDDLNGGKLIQRGRGWFLINRKINRFVLRVRIRIEFFTTLG